MMGVLGSHLHGSNSSMETMKNGLQRSVRLRLLLCSSRRLDNLPIEIKYSMTPSPDYPSKQFLNSERRI
ncbi:hypothetical protein AQUCO_07700044v1 [Aquilegia coerulea]|uniref:Uncharacterized protein n=1 Tax=Aquilegia coerulea TaxID=218851 RepID=A0A2G5C875_AQUCA|nr:hypothetical protein AQUCO_07700044v1 [Aquilegia coerulea]PIA27493.1 hypothetical protein AQUCO_07700044v1 [Aquilegia coerulea]